MSSIELPTTDDQGTATDVTDTAPFLAHLEPWVYRGGLILLGVQFVALVVVSAFEYHRFTLGIDFAIFNQAWTLIGTGHLNPTSTIHGVPYLKNHFELIMWPLALLRPLFHSPFVLLVIQDLALVGTEVVAFTWVTALLRRSSLSTNWVMEVGAGALVLLLATPGVYTTVIEDFHFEALATFFVVFAAFDLWSGRQRRMWVWVILCLLCGDISGIYVFALGISGMVVRDRRRSGVALALVGLAWVGMISLIGANQGTNISTGYAYLAGRTSLPSGGSSLWLIVTGLLTHPARAWHIATPRAGTAARYVLNGGGVGFFSPWGFAMPLIVLSTSVLQYQGIFIGLPFQNIVVIPFVLFGSAWLVVWLAKRAKTSAGTNLAIAIAILALVTGVASSAQRLPTAFDFNASGGFVSASDAAALGKALARTPSDAEVMAPVPTVGRFAQRRYVYLLVDTLTMRPAPVAVSSRTVVVVVDPGIEPALLPPSVSQRLIRKLEAQGARVLVASDGVTALLWHPPPGVTVLQLS